MAIAVKEMAKIICTMYFGSAYSNMHDYINRNLEKILLDDLSYFPAVAILGSRQCGKSTLTRHIKEQISDFVYLDLENLSDLNKLNDIELFFEQDIPQLGINIPSLMLQRFFSICAHTTGQVTNFSKMGQVLSVSHLQQKDMI